MSDLLACLPRPCVMGVVNVTPDSFSDGGEFFEPPAAVAHGLRLASEGADLLDVGGESTRPGSDPVPVEEELRRVLPVIERLHQDCGVPISIDTTKAPVARAAIAAGARMVNDVSALRSDPGMAAVVAESGAALCLMHMRGVPKTMQDDPRYDDVVAEVRSFLEERLSAAVASGVPEASICLDPGIGFGKTLEHNLALLRDLGRICAVGRPVVVGASRKRFLGALTARGEGRRLAATVAANVMALRAGASIFRVHDVADNRDALVVAAAIMGES